MTALEYNPDPARAEVREVAGRLWRSLQDERFHDEKRVDVDVADLLVLIGHAEATA